MIPPGHVGIGEGVFVRVGCPRPWLRPLFRLAERRGIAIAEWGHDVPFRVENRIIGGRAVARREFLLPGRTWTMVDAVSLVPSGRLVDALGARGEVTASFDVAVHGDGMTLISARVGVRAGPLRLRLPAMLSPCIRVTERHDGARQHVAVTIDMPLLGRVYEYEGAFAYRVEEES